jgi:hypothetical protein
LQWLLRYSSIKENGYEELAIRKFERYLNGDTQTRANDQRPNGCFQKKIRAQPVLKKQSLRLKNVQFLFLMLSGGLCVALAVIVGELSIFKSRYQSCGLHAKKNLEPTSMNALATP